VAVLVAVAIAPAALAKKPWEKIAIPVLNDIKMPAYERVELDSGMILFLAEDHQFPLVELSATIDVGSFYEPADKVGLADMTGTVMRSGGTLTRGGDEIDELVEARGLSVETWIGVADGGAYLSALKEDTDLGLELLADILRNPAFPEDKIKLAKEQEKAGISRRNDTPDSIARREAMKAVFGPDHPLARHPEYDSIAAVTRQDMIDFHADWFHPDRMYLVVIGDFDSKDMVARIEKVFAGWAKATKPLPADPEMPLYPRTVNVVDRPELTQTTVFMAHAGIRADDPNYAGVQVANRILGGGFASRLFSEVRSRQGLAYSVGSTPGTGFRNPGLFAGFTMTKSGTSEKAAKAVLTEIEKMTTTEVTDAELAQAKDAILNSEVFSYDTKREILDRAVIFERYGYPADFLKVYQDNVKRMTKADVLAATSAVWRPADLTILAVGNTKDFDADFSSFGPVTMVDVTIPEASLDIPMATPASLEQGRALMAAAAEASGGVKKLTGLKSYAETMVLDATIQGMAMTFTIEKTVVFPDKIHTVQKTPFGNMKSVVAGDKGWSESPMGNKDLDGAALAAAKEELKTDTMGIMRNLDSYTFQALEQRKIEGRLCNPVYATGVGEDYRILFLDAASNQVVMVQQPGQNPASGAPVTQKVYVDEYQQLDGLVMPKKLRITYDDEEFGTGTIESFEANPKVDMALFNR
jgi:predicted Zn-dependent peptidase